MTLDIQYLQVQVEKHLTDTHLVLKNPTINIEKYYKEGANFRTIRVTPKKKGNKNEKDEKWYYKKKV